MKSCATKSTACMTTFSQKKKNSSRQNDNCKLEGPKKSLEATQLFFYGVFTRVGSFLVRTMHFATPTVGSANNRKANRAAKAGDELLPRGAVT